MELKHHFQWSVLEGHAQLSELLDSSAIDEAILESWLESLSKLDMDQQAQVLEDVLFALSDAALDDDLRALCLASLHTAANVWVKKAQVTSKKMVSVARYLQAQRIYHSLAQAYTRQIEQLVQTDVSQIEPLMHTAMVLFARSYYMGCLAHHPALEFQWHNMHALYLLAFDQRYEALFQRTEKDQSATATLSFIDDYKRALLLSRSDCYQLRIADIHLIWQLLGLWIRHSDILDLVGINTYFMVELLTDQGLVYAEPEPDAAKDHVIGLDVSRLTSQIQRFLSEPKENPYLSKPLMAHLHRSWGQKQQRTHHREDSNAPCQVALGFSGAHFMCNEQQSLQHFLAEFGQDVATPSFEISSGDAWEQTSDIREDLSDHAGVDANIEYDHSDGVESDGCQLTGVVSNAHQQGLCVSIKAALPQRIFAGELVWVAYMESDLALLCSVRWVKNEKHSTTLGLQFLAEQVAPAAVVLIQASGDSEQFGYALISNDDDGQSLFIAARNARKGMKGQLLYERQQTKIILNELMDQSPSWHRYRFSIIESAEI